MAKYFPGCIYFLTKLYNITIIVDDIFYNLSNIVLL